MQIVLIENKIKRTADQHLSVNSNRRLTEPSPVHILNGLCSFLYKKYSVELILFKNMPFAC